MVLLAAKDVLVKLLHTAGANVAWDCRAPWYDFRASRKDDWARVLIGDGDAIAFDMPFAAGPCGRKSFQPLRDSCLATLSAIAEV